MASNHAEIWKALKDYLEDYPNKPAFIAYGGESFAPPSPNAPYWIVDDVRFDPIRQYYGSNDPNWLTGMLQIGVMVPLTWTDLQSAEYAGALADYFAQDTAMSYGNAYIRVAKHPFVSQAGYRDKEHFRLPVSIGWEGWSG